MTLRATMVGVVPGWVCGCDDLTYGNKLKQAALLFDKLLIPALDETVRLARSTNAPLAADLDWLAGKELIAEADRAIVAESNSDQYVALHQQRIEAHLSYLPYIESSNSGLGAPGFYLNLAWGWRTVHHYVARYVAARLSELEPESSFSVVDDVTEMPLSIKATKGDVLRIILRNVPVPSNGTPWENILDIREDSNSRLKLLRLRRWAREIANKGLSPPEIKEEIEYLTNSYKEVVNLYSTKFSTGTLECFVTTTAEVMENLLKLKLSALVKMPFELKKGRMRLLEAEASAEGRDLAYLVKLRDSFR